jgi:hypothetical protein
MQQREFNWMVLLPVAMACSSGLTVGAEDDAGAATGGMAALGGAASATGGRDMAQTMGGSWLTGGMAATGGAPSPATGGAASYTACNAPGRCVLESAASAPRLVNVLLVVDKSGSFSQPTASGVTKWQAMRQSLDQCLNSVASAGDISFGLDLFPKASVGPTCTALTPTNNECCLMPELADPLTVPVGPASVTVPQILDVLDRTVPGGGTPAAAALGRALYYFTAGAGAALPGEKYVLLTLDGGPNCNLTVTTECPADHCTRNLDGAPGCTPTGPSCCNSPVLYSSCLDDAGVRAEIESLRAVGISTLVLGFPGSEPYQGILDQFALVGALPASGPLAYYVPGVDGSLAEVTRVLQGSTGNLLVSCDMPLDQPPPNPNGVEVWIDCVPLSADSWVLSGASISLIGDACDQVASRGAHRIDVLYACEG